MCIFRFVILQMLDDLSSRKCAELERIGRKNAESAAEREDKRRYSFSGNGAEDWHVGLAKTWIKHEARRKIGEEM